MSFRELAMHTPFLSFVQRLAVIGVLGAILWRDSANTTAWAMAGAVVADLFHAARINGNGSYTNGTAAR